MSDTVIISLPEGCVSDGAHVMVSARTRAEYARVLQYAKEQGRHVMVGDQTAQHGEWVSWTEPETGIRFQVGKPTLEQEEQYDHDNLAAKYNRGRR